MPDIVAKVVSPSQIGRPGNDSGVALDGYSRKCLAQGDSWFSIGAVPPWATTNLPEQFVFCGDMVIVNCAHPGRELAHMADCTFEPEFLRLLRGNLSYRWDAIFLSGGGNDLIDALQAAPGNPLNQRLLRVAAEWGAPEQGTERYISETGWSAFDDHMNQVLDNFLAERDDGQNAGQPVFFHTYDYPTPRDAPAFIGVGPWLYAALHDSYQIPQEDWVALSNELFDRLTQLLTSMATARVARHVYLVISNGTIARATPGSPGNSGDWQNEIHPNAHGYSQLAQKWRPVVEPVLWP